MLRTASYSLFLLVCLAFACARVGAPTGGEKDVTPPRVDSLASTRNFQTNFTGRRIELEFDEFVTLQDVSTQIVVSPPLARRPEVTLRGKRVVFELADDEVLRPNTTYTISFGTAVKDFHEGNVAKDLRFVFSTGTQIDSLLVAGQLFDAFSGETAKDIAVLLYENLADSAVLRERPFYYALSDENGQFAIRNVRPDTFRLVAVEDIDRNVRWNGTTEKFAFADSLLIVAPGRRNVVPLRLYTQPGEARLLQRSVNQYGTIRLTYSGPPDTAGLRALAPDVRLRTERLNDTLLVYYDRPGSGNWQLLAGTDTVAVRGAPSREEFLRGHRLIFAEDVPPPNPRLQRNPAQTPALRPGPPRTVAQNPRRSAVLAFATPIASVDTALWLLTSDSARVSAFTARTDSARLRQIRLTLDWRPGKQYQLVLLPGAVTDFYGVSNVDTLRRTYSVVPEKQLGGLNLTSSGLRPGTPYVLQLLNGAVLEEERVFVAAGPENRQEFRRLTTAAYTVRLIEDTNGNGRWDAGNYFTGRQPERIFSKKLEGLRPNWEVEATISTSGNNTTGRLGRQ